MPGPKPDPLADAEKAREAEAEFAAYVRSRCISREDRDRQKLQEHERRLELCRHNPVFFHFTSFGFGSKKPLINGFKYHFKVGTFRCEQCNSAPFGPHWAHPHLDPASVLTQPELRRLRLPGEKIGSENVPESPAMRSCISRLRDAWEIPITAGTRLGPCRLELGRPPIHDLETVWLSGCVFVRRWAVHALRKEGFDFDFVEVATAGRFAKETDYVQLIVPVVAHEAIHPKATYCASCCRVNEENLGWNDQRLDYLYLKPALHRHPVFSTIEKGNLFLSQEFVKAANKLGIKGLVEGTTIHPWPALQDPLDRVDAAAVIQTHERRVRRSPQV